VSADKEQVLREAFRILRSGGRLGISDVIADEDLDTSQRKEAEDRIGCACSTLTEREYEELLGPAGLAGVSITVTSDVGAGRQSAIVKAAGPRCGR
jgi:hypothetical protein